MQRILSTYLFVSEKLTAELLGQIAEAGFQALEIFAARSHFDYATKAEVQRHRRRPCRAWPCISLPCTPPPAAT